MSALLAVALTAGVASAQTNDTAPAWSVSKPVNKIANKKLFDDHRLRASHITVSTIAHPNQASTKAVHRTSKTGDEGNVISRGYPTWTISKAVHR